MNPPFSFDRCPHCGEPKSILEAIYLEWCEDCEIDRDLDRKRYSLYAILGITITVNQALAMIKRGTR